MTHTTQSSKKRIAAITMARNDTFFLSRWIKYYGDAIGTENLYIYLDGIDQETPENAGNAHITKLPHTDMSRTAGDKYRIDKLSDLASKLLAQYDITACERRFDMKNKEMENDSSKYEYLLSLNLFLE